jgi:integrase
MLSGLKYLSEVKTKKGKTVYRFAPPPDAVAAGVARNQTFRDGRTARHEVPKLIEKIEAFRRGDIVAGNIGPASTLRQVVGHYLVSPQFLALANNSQKLYENRLEQAMDTDFNSKTFGDVRVKNLNAMVCHQVYHCWVEDGSVAKANELSRIVSVVFNHCRSLDMINDNPMSKVRKLKHEPRYQTWQPEQVELFLDTAFSSFRWRNVGLIALMCYDWAQRPTDIRLLKWSGLDLDKQVVTIKQTKRGATVQMPVSDELTEMLTQQKKDWGFQDYVVPRERPSDGAYRPLDREQVSYLANEVKAAAGLPDDLWIGDLRKTGIVEMIEAGVDSLQIMSVTGHQNVQSLNPYHRHTLKAATNALEMRRNRT